MYYHPVLWYIWWCKTRVIPYKQDQKTKQKLYTNLGRVKENVVEIWQTFGHRSGNYVSLSFTGFTITRVYGWWLLQPESHINWISYISQNLVTKLDN